MFRFERDALKQLPEGAFVRRVDVRFQDVDAAGIIFYARVLDYCHDAYVDFLAKAGFPLHEALTGPWIAPIRHAEADYLKPMRFGDRIGVALVAAHLEPAEDPTEVTIGYRIARVADGELAAVGQTVHTFVDAATFRRTPIPEPLRNALTALSA